MLPLRLRKFITITAFPMNFSPHPILGMLSFQIHCSAAAFRNMLCDENVWMPALFFLSLCESAVPGKLLTGLWIKWQVTGQWGQTCRIFTLLLPSCIRLRIRLLWYFLDLAHTQTEPPKIILCVWIHFSFLLLLYKDFGMCKYSLCWQNENQNQTTQQTNTNGVSSCYPSTCKKRL